MPSATNKRTSLKQIQWLGRQLVTKVIPVVGIAVLLIIFWPYLSLSSAERSFVRNIKSRLSEGATAFPVSEVTDFEWDKVCLLFDFYGNPPYDVLAANGVTTIHSARHADRINLISKQSDIAIFVFAKDGKTAEIIYNPSESISFNGTDYQFSHTDLCVTARNAVFKIRDKQAVSYKNGQRVLSEVKSNKYKLLALEGE